MHAAIMLAYFFGVSWIVYSTLRHDHTTDKNKNKHTHTHTLTCTSHQTSKQINTQHRKHTPSAKEGEVFWRMLYPPWNFLSETGVAAAPYKPVFPYKYGGANACFVLKPYALSKTMVFRVNVPWKFSWFCMFRLLLAFFHPFSLILSVLDWFLWHYFCCAKILAFSLASI